MARNGSGEYSLPANTAAVSGATISSTKFNSIMSDIESTLNTARPVVKGGTGATTASAARTNLGLAIGTDVQAHDAGLASIAGLTTAADKMIYTTALDTYAVADLSAFARTILDDADASAVRMTIGAGTGSGDLLAANNLSDLASASTARSNLGLGNMATASYSDAQAFTSTLTVTGNVGIGTTSPTFTYGGGLEIQQAGDATLRLERTGATASAVELSATSGVVEFDVRTSSDLAISTAATERMRIASDGKVGIGVTTPEVKLEISRLGGDPTAIPTLDANTALLVHSGAGTSGSGAKITVLGGNASEVGIELGDVDNASAGAITYRHSDNSLAFDTAATERLRVTSGGAVGIGTSSPNETLHVNGETQTKAPVVTTSGTLTQASHLEGHVINMNGNVTLPTAAAGCHCVLIAAGGVRTITRGSGLALYVNGTNTASVSLADRKGCSVVYTSGSSAYLTGDVT